MAKNKYALLAAREYTASLAIDIYEVKVDHNPNDSFNAEIVSPVTGHFIPLPTGRKIIVLDSNIFDTKKEALEASLYMMSNLVLDASKIKDRSMGPLLERIFNKPWLGLARVIGARSVKDFGTFYKSVYKELKRAD